MNSSGDMYIEYCRLFGEFDFICCAASQKAWRIKKRFQEGFYFIELHGKVKQRPKLFTQFATESETWRLKLCTHQAEAKAMLCCSEGNCMDVFISLRSLKARNKILNFCDHSMWIGSTGSCWQEVKTYKGTFSNIAVNNFSAKKSNRFKWEFVTAEVATSENRCISAL